MDKKTNWSYDKVAKVYELLAGIYSLGRIKKSKVSEIERMKPGDSVLYIGVGAGEEAVEAAKRGVNVTCVDISEKMINLTRKRFEENNQKAEFICADIFKIEGFEGKFDVVITNYF